MSAAALDRLLAVLVAALLVTGLISARRQPANRTAVRAAWRAGGSLLAAVGWKLWRSVPRAAAPAAGATWRLAMLLALLTIAALVGGFAWVISGRILALGRGP